jgi:hypothetical protein
MRTSQPVASSLASWSARSMARAIASCERSSASWTPPVMR